MTLIDVSTLTAASPMAPSSPPDATGQASAEVFARLLVQELQRSLPQGGMLGGGALASLEPLITETLASQLASGNALGLDGLFAGTRSRSSAPPPPSIVPGGRVTSRFGMRTHPIHGRHMHHDGVDIAAPEGTPIRAAAPGRVVAAGFVEGLGNRVVLDHGQGLQTVYAHCRKLTVRPGESLGHGQPLGTVGQTGLATGPHLHFEVRRDGVPVNPDELMSGFSGL